MATRNDDLLSDGGQLVPIRISPGKYCEAAWIVVCNSRSTTEAREFLAAFGLSKAQARRGRRIRRGAAA